MKKIQIAKKSKPAGETSFDREEAMRLEQIEVFEKIHLEPWLRYLADLTGLSPAEVMATIHYGTVEGFVYDYKRTGRSAHYRLRTAYVGYTPIELATLMFVAAHWRPGSPLPDRPVEYNPKHAASQAAMLLTTWKVRVSRIHTS